MFKKPAFWLILIFLSVGCVIFSGKYFSRAFPFVSLDIKMDRAGALDAAKELAQKYNWGPEDFKQAASFGVDDYVQNFVELEAGGTEAFEEMIKGQYFSPYTWRIRHFKHGQTNETLIQFTPAGQPYGFWEKIPEDLPGAALDPNEALAIAQVSATEDWQIDLDEYELVEKSQEVRPSQRIDHKFIYERPDVKIGEGNYRMRLVVAGDKLTELTHFVKVPEAFGRRFRQMRSANKTISLGASVSAGVLYFGGGCVMGLFALLRKRWVLWKKPLLWGLFIALVQVALNINYLPLIWMFYDTAITTHGFLLQILVQVLLGFVGMWMMFTLSFMAAETLTRKAFPNHIQMWRLWSPEVAASKPVLARTCGGYLLVGFFFAFLIAFYFLTTKTLGWWMPSGSMFEPDMLATYFPWLTSIAISLQAGFWEECLFRAVPIAGAALLGQRFGRRRLWIFSALIIQAVIFGAAHANYPNQPAYARLVELILPSIGWGLIYLYFGLLPGIVLHFTVDVVMISMPLFVSSTPGIWIDRGMVIVLTLVPLWVVLASRLRAGRWNKLTGQHFNRSWLPSVKIESEPQIEQPQPAPKINPGIKRFVLATGIVGLILWFTVGDFESPVPPLTIDRTEVENLARKNLADRGIELPESWKFLATVITPLNQDDRFVWQNGSEQQYKDLIGTYLDTPFWYVRFVQFEGDVAERAEEYQVYIPKETDTPRLAHKLPEAREGANLTEPQARDIAHTFITEKYQMDPAELEEISAIPAKRPDRTDWEFTFRDKQNYPLEEGQGRITIEISGDEVTDYYSYIHIPEEWQRQDRDRQNLTQIIQSLGSLLIVIALLAALVISVINWSRGRFSIRTFRQCQFLLIGLGVIKYINDWPNTIAGFTTAEPFSNQVFGSIATSILMMLFAFSCLALLAGFLQDWKNRLPQNTETSSIWVGFSLGASLAGIGAIASIFFKPLSQPYWPQYENFGAYIPALATACEEIFVYVAVVIVSLIFFASLEKFTNAWTRRKLLASILLILLGLILAAFDIDTISSWLIEGSICGIVIILIYRFVLRSNLSLIPAFVASLLIFDQIRQAIVNPYPSAISGALLTITLAVIAAIYFRRKLLSEQKDNPSTQTLRHLPDVL